jgi:hypothetical protein
MAWAFQSVTVVGTSSATTLTPTLPATYSTGSLLVLFVAQDRTGTATSTQSYTNIVSNNLIVTNNLYAAVWSKIATSGSETAPTLTFSQSLKTEHFMVAYSNVDSFDAVSTLATTNCPTGTTNCNTNTLTTTASNDLILSFFAGLASSSNANTLTYGIPSGTTSRLNQAGFGDGFGSTTGVALRLVDKNQVATGTSTADTSAAVKVGASTGISGQYQIAFKPLSTATSNFFFFM